MLSLKDRVKQAVTTGGTGALVLGAASSGYQALAAADDGKLFPYVIEDGAAWETGFGTYTHAGAGFARTLRKDSSTGAALDVSTSAHLFVDWTATAAQGAADMQAGYIAGLELQWVSGSAINITSGSAHIESLNAVINAPSTLNITGIALGNNAWGYVYLRSDGTAECVTTAPAAPYSGSARSKTADTSRRLIGAVRTDATGNIYPFYHDVAPGLMGYRTPIISDTNFRVLFNGMATVSTTISCSTAVPPFSTVGALQFFNNTTNSAGAYSASADDTLTTSNYFSVSGTAVRKQFAHPLSASQEFKYLYNSAPATNGFTCDITGYYFSR